jgi:flavin-dependent dehydrogenase
VLIGDAAGYLDAITGEGLSLAFRAALILGEIAPEALSRGARRESLARYDRAAATAYARYVRLTRLVLALSAKSAVRRRVVRWLAEHPKTFEAMIAWGLRG